MQNTGQTISLGRFVRLALLAWLAMIGFDFFWHAGLLARLYAEPSPFLLPPERAFAFIPGGYLTFLMLAILLIWLMARLGVQGWRQGAIFGLQLGALSWGAFTLGLLSISTATPVLLLGWFFGQTTELAIAGMVAGSGFTRPRLGRLFSKVLAFMLGAFAITVIVQSMGLAPTVRR
jgi:hypothetical protein